MTHAVEWGENSLLDSHLLGADPLYPLQASSPFHVLCKIDRDFSMLVLVYGTF